MCAAHSHAETDDAAHGCDACGRSCGLRWHVSISARSLRQCAWPHMTVGSPFRSYQLYIGHLADDTPFCMVQDCIASSMLMCIGRHNCRHLVQYLRAHSIRTCTQVLLQTSRTADCGTIVHCPQQSPARLRCSGTGLQVTRT